MRGIYIEEIKLFSIAKDIPYINYLTWKTSKIDISIFIFGPVAQLVRAVHS